MKLPVGFFHGDGPTRIEADPFVEIGGVSDRACAVMVATICEKRIDQALRAELRDDANLMNTLFQPEGPVGAFKSKIHLAYAMYLLSDDAYHDLKIIAGVRNDFAHKFDVTSFDNQSISGRCANLKLPELYYFEEMQDSSPRGMHYSMKGAREALKDARSRYVASTMLIANQVAHAIAYPEHGKAKKPYI